MKERFTDAKVGLSALILLGLLNFGCNFIDETDPGKTHTYTGTYMTKSGISFEKRTKKQVPDDINPKDFIGCDNKATTAIGAGIGRSGPGVTTIEGTLLKGSCSLMPE